MYEFHNVAYRVGANLSHEGTRFSGSLEYEVTRTIGVQELLFAYMGTNRTMSTLGCTAVKVAISFPHLAALAPTPGTGLFYNVCRDFATAFDYH
jgi:hypothetical protein